MKVCSECVVFAPVFVERSERGCGIIEGGLYKVSQFIQAILARING